MSASTKPASTVTTEVRYPFLLQITHVVKCCELHSVESRLSKKLSDIRGATRMPNFLRKSKQTLPVPWIGGQHVDDARAAYGEDGPYLATKRSSVNNSSLPPLYARFATTSGDRSDQTSDSSNERMYVPHHASSSSVQVDTSPPPPPSKVRSASDAVHV